MKEIQMLKGKTLMTFGKYKGTKCMEVVRTEEGRKYLNYLRLTGKFDLDISLISLMEKWNKPN